jgi:Spy/CpxP family protein refolding chaperone
MQTTFIFRSSLARLLSGGLMLASSIAWAGPTDMPGGPFVRDLFSSERLANELNLSDTQRSAVETLMEDMRKQARPHVRTLLVQRQAMRALSESEIFDEAAVRAQAAQGSGAMTELAVLHARSEYEMGKLLTPAQREKMHKTRDRHHRR